MRARRLIIASSCTLLSLAAAGACGGSTSGNSATADSGTGADVTLDTNVAKDTGADTGQADTGASCDLDADLTAQIPDASLGDAGDQTTGLCLACLNTPATCGQYIAQCNADCACKNVVPGVLSCIAGGGGQSCLFAAAGLPPASQTIGLNLLKCLQADCANECVPASLRDGSADAADAD